MMEEDSESTESSQTSYLDVKEDTPKAEKTAEPEIDLEKHVDEQKEPKIQRERIQPKVPERHLDLDDDDKKKKKSKRPKSMAVI